MTYSYVKSSPGYVETVLAHARKELLGFGAEFSDLFVEKPVSEEQKKARDYFLKLNNNEQAALREHYNSEKNRFDVC